MPSLRDDLKRYKNERYTKQQLIAGLKLIVKAAIEIGGLVTVLIAVSQLLSYASGVLAWVGVSLSPVVIRQIMIAAARGYVLANEEERKEMRAAASWITSGFSFERFAEEGATYLGTYLVDQAKDEAIGEVLEEFSSSPTANKTGTKYQCPYCKKARGVIKKGFTQSGKQRYYCKQCNRSWS